MRVDVCILFVCEYLLGCVCMYGMINEFFPYIAINESHKMLTDSRML